MTRIVVASRRPSFHAAWAAAIEPRGDALVRATALADIGAAGATMAIIDLALLEGDRRLLLAEVQQAVPGIRLVLGSDSLDPATELAGLATGAAACCNHQAGRDELARVVDVVLGGGVWISRNALPMLVGKLQELSARPGQPARVGAGGTATGHGKVALDALTSREREVAKLIGQGASNKQVALQLDITDRTVKAHLTSIFDKLGVTDRLQLALLVRGG